MWVRKDKQIHKHTNTQFSENNFNKKCGHKCTIYTNGIYLIQSILIVVIIKVSCVGFLLLFLTRKAYVLLIRMTRTIYPQ